MDFKTKALRKEREDGSSEIYMELFADVKEEVNIHTIKIEDFSSPLFNRQIPDRKSTMKQWL